jgi:hypothetical protein
MNQSVAAPSCATTRVHGVGRASAGAGAGEGAESDAAASADSSLRG